MQALFRRLTITTTSAYDTKERCLQYFEEIDLHYMHSNVVMYVTGVGFQRHNIELLVSGMLGPKMNAIIFPDFFKTEFFIISIKL